MPVYIEMIKDKKTGKMIEKKVGPEKKKQYYIRTYVTDEFGNRKQVTRHNKEWLGLDGKNKAQQEENIIKNKKYNQYEEISLGEVIDKYFLELKNNNKESTVYAYESVINNNIIPFFPKNTKIYNLDEEKIIKWHKWLTQKNYSIRYKNKCNMVMSSIIKTAIKFYKLRINVVSLVGNFQKNAEEREQIIEDKEKLEYITYDEFQTFIKVINNPLWYTFFYTLYFTGVRKGEIQALCWNDIDFKKKEIKITKTLSVKTKISKWKITSTKNLKNRKIDMDDKLVSILKKYYNFKSQEQGFNNNFFVFGNQEPLKQHKIDTNKDKYFSISGIKRITIHQFRHSHVSFLANEYIKKGQTDSTKFFIMMSARLGHTIKVMQDTYLHFFDDIQNEIVSLINSKK